MPTVVTKVVKYTGGDYTTIQAALNATPSDLVAADEQWDILIDESASGNTEWSVTSLSVPARTTDATRFIRIKPNTGKGFKDNANKLTNALRYNASNGVAIKGTASFNTILTISAQYTSVEGIQFIGDAGSNGQDIYAVVSYAAANVTVRDCIIGLRATATQSRAPVSVAASNSRLINSVVTGTRGVQVSGSRTLTIANCTIVYSGAASGTRVGVYPEFGTVTVKNTAVFGFAEGAVSTAQNNITSSSDYNATDSSAPTNWGSNSLSGLTAADQIESTTTTSVDARAKASGSLDGEGTRDQTNTADLDIVGQSRPTSGPSIGAWEAAPVSPSLDEPTGVTVGSATPNAFTVSWTDASTGETGFEVGTSPAPHDTWTAAPASPADAGASSLVVTGLTPGVTYKARVRAAGTSPSAWVESGTITTVSLTYLKPISVSSAGPWTASSGTAVSAVDETVADDADYITAASAGRISYKIESHTDPTSDNWHAVAFRARATGGRSVTVKWWQGDPASGGTEIASETVTPGASFADYRLELTSGEAAAITDRTNVYVSIDRD